MTKRMKSRRSEPVTFSQKNSAPVFGVRARKALDEAIASLADGDLERGKGYAFCLLLWAAFLGYIAMAETGII